MKKAHLFLLSLIIFLFWNNGLTGQEIPLRFEHLSTRDGLSNNRVTSIFKDKLGYTWLGTISGLNRYNGYDFTVFKYESGNRNSINNNTIIWIAEGPSDNLWIKTGNGLQGFNIYSERFMDVSHVLTDAHIDIWNVNKIIKDQNQNYWLAVQDHGVYKIVNEDSVMAVNEGENANLTDISFDLSGNLMVLHDDGKIQNININTHKVIGTWYLKGLEKKSYTLNFFIDGSGSLWIWSKSIPIGLFYYDQIGSDPRIIGKKELSSILVSEVVQDEVGNIIVATDHGGITIISKSDWTYQNYRNNITDDKSLSHDSAISAYRDVDGVIWIGTNKGGVNFYHPKKNYFKYFYYQGDDPSIHNDIKSLIEDDLGNFWLGTDGAGLLYFDRDKNKYKAYRHQANNESSLSSDVIVTLEKDQGGIWIGTFHGGLNYFDGKTFKRYFNDPADSNYLEDDSVWELFIDSHGNMWVGTLQNGAIVYNADGQKIHHFSVENGNLNSSYVIDFEEDIDGKIWIATSYGVEVFDPLTGKKKHYLNNPKDKTSLVENSVVNITLTEKKDMWIGTRGGLCRYNRQRDSFERLTQQDGLVNNYIVSLAEDNDNNLWISTNEGLSKLVFTEDGYSFINFDDSDGLQGDNFNENSAIKTRSGELAFGGLNGLNVFNPKEIIVIDQQHNLVFTEFYISNKRIQTSDTVNGRVLINDGLYLTKDLHLRHFENSFTFEFADLNLYHPEKVLYRYKLEGFDENWVVASSDHRKVNYTNLDPGKYVFKVKSSKGIQDKQEEEIQMAIVIDLPFWKTPLAFLVYVIVSASIFLIIRKTIVDRERLKARIERDRLESDKLHQLDMMKIKFFTNISHEFRTPLTLIITPIERILKATRDNKYFSDFNTIHRNARRLLTLVNQLLDMRKIESGQINLSVSGGDLISFVREIVDSFVDLAIQKNITVHFKSSFQEFMTQFDRDKMEKVMVNLLSNAFKFTPKGGSITVEIIDNGVRRKMHDILIKVSDSGIGIEPGQMDKIFERFYQVENNNEVSNHGSGIGLSITREFVELHGGTISVESMVGEGSIFIVKLPLKDVRVTHGVQDELIAAFKSAEKIDSMPDLPTNKAVNQEKYTVILVEDNDDFRYYLRDNMKEIFNILEAENGKIAWKLILEHKPDLVVSDIMMPEMDGFGLTEKIKSDPRTIHLPIILLTAHTSDQSKIAGLEAGAIEYLTKPFNFEVLVSSIKSSLKFQEQVRQSEKMIEVSPTEINITSLDEKLIQNALRVVEENIANPDFSVQELSRELGVSRGQLYKKILAITSQTPIEFIRYIRLKRAILLLEKSQLTVAEVAYKVGFNNPRYFTKYFKAVYKTVPSKYIQRKQIKSS